MQKLWAYRVWLVLLLLLILAVLGGLQNWGHYVSWVLALLIGVTLMTLGGLYLYGRRSLPRMDSRLSISGVSAPVEIIRDVDAVPHIYAQSKLDAFLGLGFVHAQDRLWQMDFERHIGYGRLAEILGPSLVSTDRFLRTLGAHRTAQDTFQALPVNVQEIIKAYVAGINAFLHTHKGARLPPEFTILAVTPEPWSCYDVVVWQKMIGWNLGNNFWTELLRRDLVAALGFEGMQQLTQDDPGSQAVTINLEGVRERFQGHPDLPSFGEQGQSFIAGLPTHNDGAGSNSWVADGSRHSNTKPFLACDPHLGTSIPSNWYLAHLVAPDLDVIGATLPGLPAVVVGRNSSIAWGITNLFCDVQDLFRERLDPEGAMAEYEGHGEPIKIITETIQVKGKPDVEHQIRFTRHGPLISDVLDSKIPEPLALRWTGFDSQDISISAFIGVNEAQNWDEFTASLAKLITPTLNFIYADTDGNIGYHAAGRVPIRKGGDGTLPAEGWSGQAEWQDWIPFNQLPHTYNPPEHYLVNANNCPVSDEYPYFLGCQWAPPYRAQRITELIQAHEKMSLHDHMAIQGDTVSLQAREYLPYLLPAVQPKLPEEELAIQLLTHWDHNMQGDSPAAAIFAAWLLQLPKAILENILEEELLDRYQEFYTFTSKFLLSTLLTRSKGVQAGSDPSEPDRLEQAIADAFRAALKLLRKHLGGDPNTWRWSRLHTVVLPHQPFHKVRPLRRLFSRTVTQGGDWSTVNCGAFNTAFQQSLIAGYRQVIDLSNQDGSVYIQTPGQSGHLLSPHYDDYLADWKNTNYRKMRFTRASVIAGQRSTLWLTPPPAIPRERMTDLGAADHHNRKRI